MSDSLAAINVDQLSSAVNAVVQATAIGQLPLDPSPPPTGQPDHGVTAHHPAAMFVPPHPHGPGGTQGQTLLSLPSEITIPVSSLRRATSAVVQQVTLPHPQTHPPSTFSQLPTQNIVAPTSRPVVFQLNIPNNINTTPANHIVAATPGNSLNLQQPQSVGRQLYTLKQIGSKLVLVPSAPQNMPIQTSLPPALPSLVHQTPTSNDTVIFQPGNSLVQGSTVGNMQSVCTQNSSSLGFNTQHPPHINMNIAIHLANNGLAQQLTGANQISGCGLQAATQPIRNQISQDSTHLLSQMLNLPTVTQPLHSNPAVKVQSVLNQPGSFTILPSQIQQRPLTSQVTPAPQQVTFITSTSNTTTDSPPMHLNVNLNQNTTWTPQSTNSSSTINLSPRLNLGSQSQLAFPVTSVTSPMTSAVTLQQPTPAKGCERSQRTSSRETGRGGQKRCRKKPSARSSRRGKSRVADSQESGSGLCRNMNIHEGEKVATPTAGCWSPCQAARKGCPRGCPQAQQPSLVVQDKPVDTRARLSLPDVLTLQTSRVVPGETGVFAKVEIQADARFGPVVGRLTDVNSSTNLASISAKSWRIYSEGKVCQLLHMDDETSSNWMLFIKLRRGQHNLVASQQGQHIYFTSARPVQRGEELVVWYSRDYGRLRGVKERPEERGGCKDCHQQSAPRNQPKHNLPHDHPSLAPPQPSKHGGKKAPRDRDKHRCNLCPGTFPTASKLRAHLLRHMGVKPHCCEVCGKGFNDRSNMRAHLLIHAGVKRYTCDVCNKSFLQKVHLQSHQVTHTGHRDFRCWICQKTFARRSDLSYHMKQHKEGKKVSCSVCAARFWKESQLQRHLKTHTGQRDFHCHLCSKGFITTYHLTRHLKSCQRDQQLRRKTWPAAPRMDPSGGALGEGRGGSGAGEERQGQGEGSRGSHSGKPEGDESRFEQMRRSSRGRPIRPRILPEDIIKIFSPSSRSEGRPKRRRHAARKGARPVTVVAPSGSVGPSAVAVTLYEVRTSCSAQEVKQDFGQPAATATLSQLVMSGGAEASKTAGTPGHTATMEGYGATVEDGETCQDSSSSCQQQPSSTLSQLAIAVPQGSPMVLDCDSFTPPSSSVGPSQLESGYTYTPTDPPGSDSIHDASLTAPLFDLGEGSSMSSISSSSSQSISTYNPPSFSLGEDDNQPSAFVESQTHCSNASSLFMTDSAIADPVAGTSTQTLHHQTSGTSLSDEALFSIDPGVEPSVSLRRHVDSGMGDISVEDLRAIEGALDSDDEEQCTDERRGDSPSENVEE